MSKVNIFVIDPGFIVDLNEVHLIKYLHYGVYKIFVSKTSFKKLIELVDVSVIHILENIGLEVLDDVHCTLISTNIFDEDTERRLNDVALAASLKCNEYNVTYATDNRCDSVVSVYATFPGYYNLNQVTSASFIDKLSLKNIISKEQFKKIIKYLFDKDEKYEKELQLYS